ncbi:hypothetical protein [Paludisphaera mucosa]|uniref:DUF3040 domain-containing protein n=1 Tax=Paludisphaera mucosa TaxID=3030827 RepID=A0ABT6F9B3_9BACT|nr:hypothetical protein [Paludisphaera mucosa]MDG3004167.1 hypothetical protein [Paludisphaera mucosa]
MDHTPLELDPRRAEWQRRLGRLRLDAEPLDVQLARHRGVCWALTAVTTAIGAAFVALFAAFERPGVGLALAAAFWVPIVGLSWRDHARLARIARAYQDEEAGRT